MSVFKNQFSRALEIHPTVNAVIPSPNVMCSGIFTDGTLDTVTDANIDFVALGVSVGDIIWNLDKQEYATITFINKGGDVHTLGINVSGLFANDPYIIYQQSAKSGLGNQGCCLYFGDSGSAEITTISGDELTIGGLQPGTVLPLQVSALRGGTVTKIVALW